MTRRTTFGAALAAALTLALSSTAMAATLDARVKGRPASDNGASSFHVRSADPMRSTDEVSVVLEVRQAPTVSAVYFWALQVDFVDAGGEAVAGAHLGRQWHPAHPGGTAVNFGGYRYDRTGRAVELEGRSTLPSANGDPNTFDYAWHASTAYRLRIFRDDDGSWAGEVTDLSTDTATIVRRIRTGGTAMAKPVVWTESFAACDAPRTAVRWSAMTPAPSRYRATYQSYAQGGCTNTSTDRTPTGIVQRTNVARTTADWAILG
jgi:hypothetical protein